MQIICVGTTTLPVSKEDAYEPACSKNNRNNLWLTESLWNDDGWNDDAED